MLANFLIVLDAFQFPLFIILATIIVASIQEIIAGLKN